MINALQPAEIASVLQRHHVGRLACVVDGEPYLVPITYTYRDGVIYGHTLPGQKLKAMRAAPRVAFEIDEQWETDTWRSVVVRGVVFRIRPTETTGRVVQRSARFHRLDDVTHPLHGVDLRAGDEANFPTGNDVAPS